ncbi:HAD family hydrolase, partial [Streptomyces lydicus]|uniref:HAD family hydrolase n=1 Tax=Streptomyces lydicus TaxID=47763 RepID=UPI003330C8A3
MTGVPSLAGCLHSIGAVVFDTDGVITDSARVHAAAWKDAFDPALAAAGGQRPFDPVQDYLRHVDGRARLDGAAAFLASRGLDLPPGEEGDAPGTDTVHAVAARKEELFTARVAAGGIAVWPGTVRLLRVLRRERRG